MSIPWKPDDEPEEPDEESPDDEEPGDEETPRAVVELRSPEPLPIRIAPIPSEREYPGQAPFATYLVTSEDEDEHPRIAQGLLPAELLEALLDSEIFDEPRVIGMAVAELPDGTLSGVVAAFLPVDELQKLQERLSGEEEAEEPWKESVSLGPSFEEIKAAQEEEELLEELENEVGDDEDAEDEDAEEIDEDDDVYVPFALGAVKRFAENREHPEDPALDALALWAKLLGGEAVGADSKAVENLLKDL